MHGEIDAVELLNRINKGEKLNLLDVREALEFHSFNIGGSNVPLKGLSEQAESTWHDKGDEIIVICSAGLRSVTAAILLAEKGYTRVRNLTGGLLALRKLQH